MSATPVHAILLAAGAGRRLGLPKAALQLRGKWMLPSLVSSLKQGGASRVVLVLSDAALDAIADLGLPGADRETRNPDPDAGRTGSLQCALPEISEGCGILVHPCDMPLLQPESVQAVIETWLQFGCPENACVRPVSSSRRGGHPLLLGPGWRSELQTSHPDRPLREFLRHPNAQLIDVPCNDPGAFLDVDTPEQLQLVESLLPK
ncbi:MAG: nucleotidyltransferase family protein [Planctomycetes bacterium]|nr:nucleotidyltransferase family protein [Planctomycetota bacterium]